MKSLEKPCKIEVFLFYRVFLWDHMPDKVITGEIGKAGE